MLNMDQRT